MKQIVNVLLFSVVFSVALLAQDPFNQTFTMAHTVAQDFARVAGFGGLVYGGVRMMLGGHRAEGVIEMLMGIGVMSYAQQIATAFFS